MKFIIQKATGLDETAVIELDNLEDTTTIAKAFSILDARLAQTNQKIVEVREFIQQVKDPNYRYLFTAFMDQFLGVSSNAESLLRKFKVEPPQGFDEWVQKKDARK
jgi:hypothetical protein